MGGDFHAPQIRHVYWRALSPDASQVTDLMVLRLNLAAGGADYLQGCRSTNSFTIQTLKGFSAR